MHLPLLPFFARKANVFSCWRPSIRRVALVFCVPSWALRLRHTGASHVGKAQRTSRTLQADATSVSTTRRVQAASVAIFVSIIPVGMDTWFKYWVFTGLQRIDPAAAVTMDEIDRH